MAEGGSVDASKKAVIRFTPTERDPSARVAVDAGRPDVLGRPAAGPAGSAARPRLPLEALGGWTDTSGEGAANAATPAPRARSLPPSPGPASGAAVPQRQGAERTGRGSPGGREAEAPPDPHRHRANGMAAGEVERNRSGGSAAPAGGTRAPYQEAVLNAFRQSAGPVEVLCVGGRVVVGTLRSFDTYSLILDTSDGPTLVFKHAVATVRLARRVDA